LAPLIIVWFGIGISSKIAIAADHHVHRLGHHGAAGAKEVDSDLVKLMRSWGPTVEDPGRPSSSGLDAVDRGAFRLNVASL